MLEEVADPKPVRGQVLIDVYAAGLNFPDVLQIAGKYQFQPPFPFTPGPELAGIVTEVGMGVSNVKPGDRVMALTGTGAMAERAAADASAVESIPESMDFNVAAALGIAYGTSYHALAQAQVAAGRDVARSGCQRRGGFGGGRNRKSIWRPCDRQLPARTKSWKSPDSTGPIIWSTTAICRSRIG